MTGVNYLVEVLKKYRVTDAFGIPGGVILEMIYALKDSGSITPHLSYHEQAAGFAASGYAQASGKLGVAYATRGPGFTNMVTAIADAYCDSIPVLFITSHVGKDLNDRVRLTSNQEIDTCAMVQKVTKYAKRIDSATEFSEALEIACYEALNGRKGPVFIDVASSIWKSEVDVLVENDTLKKESNAFEILDDIAEEIRQTKRPVILIGDGINQSRTASFFKKFISKNPLPVISSRYAHNVIADSDYYFGYIGGFGVRYANFILSKADLIISLGNRLNFPINSESYHNIPYQAKIIRVDTDESELSREIPNSYSYISNLEDLLPIWAEQSVDLGDYSEWINVCKIIREELWDEDVNVVVKSIDSILSSLPSECSVISDVGNHEFWVSRACAHSNKDGNILYSKSFATLGSAMVKAIGAYYATRKPVVCFIGDQGFQMNSQELLYISQHKLPILVVVMNNSVSGMIRDKEKTGYNGRYVHSTKESEYVIPDIAGLCQAYKIDYCEFNTRNGNYSLSVNKIDWPCIVDLLIDENLSLEPSLPRGRAPQAMIPALERKRYEYLDNL